MDDEVDLLLCPHIPQGVLPVYMMGVPKIMELEKIHEAEILHPQKYQVQDLNTSKLINSIKQTLRPWNNNVTDFLTAKNTEGVNFHPPKIQQSPLVMYTASIPLGLIFLCYIAMADNFN